MNKITEKVFGNEFMCYIVDKPNDPHNIDGYALTFKWDVTKQKYALVDSFYGTTDTFEYDKNSEEDTHMVASYWGLKEPMPKCPFKQTKKLEDFAIILDDIRLIRQDAENRYVRLNPRDDAILEQVRQDIINERYPIVDFTRRKKIMQDINYENSSFRNGLSETKKIYQGKLII